MAAEEEKIVLNVEEDGNAAEGIDHIAEAATRADKKVEELQRRLRELSDPAVLEKTRQAASLAQEVREREAGPQVDRAANVQRAGFRAMLGQTIGGNLGGLVSGAASFTPMSVMGAVTDSAKKLSGIMETVGNSQLSASQKSRKIFEEVLPFGIGKALTGLADAITGTAEKIRQIQLNFEKRTALETYHQQARIQMVGVDTTTEQRRLQSVAARALPYQMTNWADRNSLTGQIEYQRQEMVQPLQMAQTRAQRDLQVAQLMHARNQQLQESAANAYRMNTWATGADMRRSDNMQRNRYAGRPELLGATRNAQLSIQARENSRAVLEAMNTQANRSEEELAQARGRAEAATRNLMAAEREFEKQREARMSQSQQRSGAMTQAEFNMSLHALGQITQAGSLDFATPGMISMAQRIAPRTVSLMSEQRGGGRNAQAFQYLESLGIGGDLNEFSDYRNGFTLAQSRANIGAQANQLVRLEGQSEQQLAAAIASAIVAYGENIRSTTGMGARAVTENIDYRERARWNAE